MCMPVTESVGEPCLGPHPCPGCSDDIPGYQVACQTDWLRVPLEKRIFYVSTFAHMFDLHGSATEGVVRWLEAHPRRAAG
jgi:hypothetical protein